MLTRKPRAGEMVRSPEVEGVVLRIDGDICHIDLTWNARWAHPRRVPAARGERFGLGETSFIWRFREGLNTHFEIVGEESCS